MTDAAPPRRKRQEQEPASPDVTEVAPGILRLQLPLPIPGLGHVNTYALEDKRGLALVDPGLPGPRSWRALVDRLRKAGAVPRQVHTVIVTHSHPDHFGGAGKLRADAGAEIVTHRSFRTWFSPSEESGPDALEPEDHGAETPGGDDQSRGADGDRDDGHPTGGPAPARRPANPFQTRLPWRDERFRPPLSRRLHSRVYRSLMRRFMKSPAPTRRLDDAEVIRLAGREWVALHTPGHTPDHLCLLDPAEGILLAGDHVLPTITPHLSGLTAGGDPLSSYFASLEKVRGLDGVELVLPAHGHPFTDLAGRADTIRQHHLIRLEDIWRAAVELGPASVETLSHRVFDPRVWGQMAESETYAHLEHLRLQGRVRVDARPHDLAYEATA